MGGQLFLSLAAAMGLLGAQELPLSAPELLSPAAGAGSVPQPVTFKWAEVKDAPAYQIQISNTDAFERPLLVDQGLTEPPFRVDVLPSITLWWRIRAMSGSGKPGTWSEVRRFRPKPLPPAAPLFGVLLSPAAIAGEFPSNGLVTLYRPAPPSGASIELSVSDASAASVDQRVEIAPGASSATFNVSTHPVAERREVRVTAVSLGVTRTATLTITPPPPPAVLLSCAVHPATLSGGNAAQGTVTLSSPAPPRGAPVELQTGDAALAFVPDTVTVPAGMRMASFTVKTGRTGISKAVTITATLGGIMKTAALTIEGTAATSALSAPEPQSPAPRESFARNRGILFRWGSVPSAASYTLQVGSSGDFSGTMVINYTLPDLETRVAPFAPQLLWWRVRANDGKGAPGEWSTPRSFEVE